MLVAVYGVCSSLILGALSTVSSGVSSAWEVVLVVALDIRGIAVYVCIGYLLSVSEHLRSLIHVPTSLPRRLAAFAEGRGRAFARRQPEKEERPLEDACVENREHSEAGVVWRLRRILESSPAEGLWPSSPPHPLLPKREA